MFVEQCVVCGVEMLDYIQVTNRDKRFIAREEDNCLVEMFSYFDVPPLNACMFVFGVTEVLEKVGYVTEDGVGSPITVDVALLAAVVVVRHVHANHALVEQIR